MKKSTRQAQRLGRLGGQASAAGRKGNREWGQRMQRKRAAKAQKQHYPGLVRLWARNANRARWGRPLEPVPPVLTPGAIADREERRLRKRREAYARGMDGARRQ
jgi:hypothetical protein